jgi:flagellar biosynthesis protein
MNREELDRAKRRAVALRYDANKDAAPKIVAKGQGYVADKIIEIARQHGLHVHHDPTLVTLLSKLDLEQDIPEDLYKAVAEVLVFVYKLGRMKR